MKPLTGLIDVTPVSPTIQQILGSLRIKNSDDLKQPGLVRLLLAGNSYSDEALVKAASEIPDDQILWAFGPVGRRVQDDNLIYTHVPANSSTEFSVKIADHILRFIQKQPAGSVLNPFEVSSWADKERLNSLDDLHTTIGRRGYFHIEINGVPFEFRSSLKPSSRLLVVLSERLRKNGADFPAFSVEKYADSINASIVHLTDPALNSNVSLKCGWWLGDSTNDYIGSAASLVKSIAASVGVVNSRITFLGRFEGASAALAMASEIPNSTAIVENPVLFKSLAVDAPDDYILALKTCIDFSSDKNVPEGLQFRLDLKKRFKRIENYPAAVVLQNLNMPNTASNYFEELKKVYQGSGRELTLMEYAVPSSDALGRAALSDQELVDAVNLLICGGQGSAFSRS